jgi:hypothetical protein
VKFTAEGRIVRNLNGLAAMHIDKYEFRTRRAMAKLNVQSLCQDGGQANELAGAG